MFRGVGRVVELSQPLGQDDLVFPSGTMHVVSTLGDLSFSINPHSCLFSGTQELTWDVTGGTGQFADTAGSVTGTVSGRALGPAILTAAARSRNSRATRWTSSRRAGRCCSDPATC